MKRILLLFFIMTLVLITSCSPAGEGGISKEEAVLAVIQERKSVRSFIKERPVSDENIRKLLKAGMAAPSGKNTQPWNFIIIKERSILDQMANELPTAKMLAEAPMAIVVCGDTIRSSYWYLDCSAATQNILLAAEAMDLGAVWAAAYPYRDRMDIVIRHTELPSHILPLVVIPIGYPKGEHSSKNKFDEKKIHIDKW